MAETLTRMLLSGALCGRMHGNQLVVEDGTVRTRDACDVLLEAGCVLDARSQVWHRRATHTQKLLISGLDATRAARVGRERAARRGLSELARRRRRSKLRVAWVC